MIRRTLETLQHLLQDILSIFPAVSVILLNEWLKVGSDTGALTMAHTDRNKEELACPK